MTINDIKSENDIDPYLEYFKKLDIKQRQQQLDEWESKIQSDEYTHLEFLTFLKLMDFLDIDNSSNNIQTVDILNVTINELKSLSDYTLDQYSGNDRQVKLLDDINKTLTECELLYKYYNEKIIN